MITAIVLAAGRSRRMGTQKLLLPLEGKPMVAVVVDELLCSPVDEVVVVLGSDGDAVRAALADRPIRFVTNPNLGGEMLSSVRCGLGAISEDATAVLVALGDQPTIAADVVARMVEAFRSGRGGIVVPTCDGRRGHPLLFSTRYREEVLTEYDGAGLRGLITTHPDEVVEVEVDKSGVLEDVDLPEDYERVAGWWRARYR